MYNAKSLNYSFSALEPYLSSETIKRHYQIYINYVDAFNKLINKNDYSLEEIIQNISKFPIKNRGEILYNASAILNHELYFNNLGLNKNELLGSFKEKIINQYGNYENFKEEFKKSASYVIGSGYTFLVLNKSGNFEIINTSNQENPYIYSLIPVIAFDLYEHAYYLDYYSREEYINSFFSMLDLEKVNSYYEKISKKI